MMFLLDFRPTNSILLATEREFSPEMREILSETVRFKAPPGLMAALSEAAGRDYRTASALMREAIVEKLREMGVSITPDRPSRSRNDAASAAGSA